MRHDSPETEIEFCSHATITSGVVLGETEGPGTCRFSIKPGEIPVKVHQRAGRWEAALTSIAPRHEPAPARLVADALAALRRNAEDLDPAVPPARAFAGAWHLVLTVRSPERLVKLDYDYERLRALMLADRLTTRQLVWRERADPFDSRNPFPVGGAVGDPATGAAAVALGGYLRDAALIAAPATILIRQGEAMGRPSRLTVEIPAARAIVVPGNAVPMEV